MSAYANRQNTCICRNVSFLVTYSGLVGVPRFKLVPGIDGARVGRLIA
jgi:hypothetical protein